MSIERQWIQQLQAQWPQSDLCHDTFWDAGTRQILTADMLVEATHFSWAFCSPQDVGWKALAANLSDIAATGGLPRWYLATIGVPSDDTSLARLTGIMHGLQIGATRFGGQLVGGDTVRAEKTTLSITVIGYLPEPSVPGRRTGAQPGDIVAVSGPHGLSRAGLEALRQQYNGFETAKSVYLRPEPRLRLGQQLSRVLPRCAMMDTSDGLADAALQIAAAGGVDILLDAGRLYCHPDVYQVATHAKVDPLDWILYGGEDFELFVSLPAELLGLFPDLTMVGTVQPMQDPTAGGQAFLKHNQTLSPLSVYKTYPHFVGTVSPSLQEAPG